jgi:hypothetical protein
VSVAPLTASAPAANRNASSARRDNHQNTEAATVRPRRQSSVFPTPLAIVADTASPLSRWSGVTFRIHAVM